MKQLRQSLFCIAVVLLTGCSSFGEIPEIYYERDRQSDYPIAIVQAQYLPDIKAEFSFTGKGSGAIVGVGSGIGKCADAFSGGQELGALLFFVTLPFCAAGGAVHGAATTESASKTRETISNFQKNLDRLRKQDLVTGDVSTYLAAMGSPAELMDAVAGPSKPEDMPKYSINQFKNYGSILELRVSELIIRGSGKKGALACPAIKLAARKIDTKSGKVIDNIQGEFRLGCRKPEAWMKNEGKPLLDSFRSGYKEAAMTIVDELYLMFAPHTEPQRLHEQNKAEKLPGTGNDATIEGKPYIATAPKFVLKPIQPPFEKKKMGFGYYSSPNNKRASEGYGLADVESLTPFFEWEAFPRSWDLTPDNGDHTEITDVVYDFRLFNGTIGPQPRMVLDHEVYSRYGLKQNRHRLQEKLSYCGWYFWTVRARFRLNGVARVTEWSGAYEKASFEENSSYIVVPGKYRRATSMLISNRSNYYYPIRTPTGPDRPECYNRESIRKQLLKARSGKF